MWEFRYEALYVIGFVVYAVANWGSIKTKALASITQAEKYAREEAKVGIERSGLELEDFAVRWGYSRLNPVLRIYITEKAFRSAVKYIYAKFIDVMDDGKLNGSVK